ncbi:L-type lectin-domain containing receptor kinase s.4, partial [Thalictrum thalictroides]
DFEFGDSNGNHVGIDIDSIESVFSIVAAYYDDKMSKQDLNPKSRRMIQAWIDYDAVKKLLNDSSLEFLKP